jgi:homocitrate synthase NifV
MKTPWFIDETLRDGVQPLGKTFSAAQRIVFVRLLAVAGVQEAIIGIPAQGPAEIKIIREVVAARPALRLTVWCRARKEDILAAQKTGVRAVHISFPVSELLQDIFHMSHHKVIDDLSTLVAFAREYFDYISIGFQDVSRVSHSQLSDYVVAASNLKVQRIRLADTVGILTPEKTKQLIWFVKALAPHTQIEFHAHNDYGLATINSLIALQSGATAVSVTINGIGERAGNAAFEEVVLGMENLYNQKTTINIRMLVPLSKYVVCMTGWHLSRNKPVTGRNITCHTSGIHCHGLLQNICSYQPFNPVLVGHDGTEIVLGTHSGKSALHGFIKQTKCTCFESFFKIILKWIVKIPFFPRVRFFIHTPE